MQSRVINGLVSKKIEERINAGKDPNKRRSHQAGGGWVDRKRREPAQPAYTSEEYPSYKQDALDKKIHATIKSLVTPEYAKGIAFLYDALRADKHPQWAIGNFHLGGSGERVSDAQRVNRYGKQLAAIGDQLAASTGNAEFSRRARITEAGKAAAAAAMKAAAKPRTFISDEHREVFGERPQEVHWRENQRRRTGQGGLARRASLDGGQGRGGNP